MLGSAIKIIPTLWPFLLEIFGVKSKKTRGGTTRTPLYRVLLAATLLLGGLSFFSYDVTWRLYRENQELVIRVSENAGIVKESKARLEALEAELNALKKDHISSEREISAANAKLDFAIQERQRVEKELEKLKSQKSKK